MRTILTTILPAMTVLYAAAICDAFGICDTHSDCLAGMICVDGQCVPSPPCIQELVTLTAAEQGSICQISYRPQASDGSPASLVLTARTFIDVNAPTNPNASGSIASVNLSADGSGVKTAICGIGGPPIEGTGSESDEELIVTFDNLVRGDSLVITLNQIDFADDDPVVFITGEVFVYVIEEAEIVAAFSSTGTDRGRVDFGSLSSVPEDLMIQKIKVRETNSAFFVDEIIIGDPAACEDNDACTTDTCDPAGGCVNTPIDPGVACDDDNACTTESCDPINGCTNTPVDPNVTCEDGDACTV